MHAALTNQISYILHFNDNGIYWEYSLMFNSLSNCLASLIFVIFKHFPAVLLLFHMTQRILCITSWYVCAQRTAILFLYPIIYSRQYLNI